MPTGPEQERRKLVEQARQDVALGHDGAVPRTRGAVLRMVGRQTRNAQLVDALASKMTERLDAFQQAGSEVVAGTAPMPIACRSGCWHCCCLSVSVTAPEVFRITEYIRRTFTPEEQAALRDRVAAQYEQTRYLELPYQYQEAEIPCALLNRNGHCSVYPVRPVMCRGHTSVDAQQCYDSLDEWWNFPITGRDADKTLSLLALDATEAALDRLGFDRPRELTEGLLVALTEPDAMERWLAGEPVFTARRERR